MNHQKYAYALRNYTRPGTYINPRATAARDKYKKLLASTMRMENAKNKVKKYYNFKYQKVKKARLANEASVRRAYYQNRYLEVKKLRLAKEKGILKPIDRKKALKLALDVAVKTRNEATKETGYWQKKIESIRSKLK